MALPRRQHDRQRSPLAIATQMQLGRQAPRGCAPMPRPPDAGSPFDIGLAGLPTRTGRVLVRTDNRAVNTDRPVDSSCSIGGTLQVGQEPVPGAVPPPAHEPVIGGLPGAVASREIPPPGPGPQLPENATDHLSVVTPLPTPLPIGRQERREAPPHPICQLVASRHSSSCLSRCEADPPSQLYRPAIRQTRPSQVCRRPRHA